MTAIRVLYLGMETNPLTERTMTYRQLGYWDNMRGKVSMASLLQAAEERNFWQRYVEGWNKANTTAKIQQNRDWRPLNGPQNIDISAPRD